MKYFTPELHVRLQGLDAREMDQADAEWERAEQKYRRRLKAIRAKLPQSVFDVLEGVLLHDAEVLWIGHARSSLRILLRLDNPPRATIELKYFLTRPARFEQAVPETYCSSTMQWMYDEVDRGKQDQSFKHSILFSNGCQLELEARRVQVTTFATVYSQSNREALAAG